MWTGEEVRAYDDLNTAATEQGVDMPDYVKEVIARHLDRGNN